MTRKAHDQIAEGLAEAIEIAKGAAEPHAVHKPQPTFDEQMDAFEEVFREDHEIFCALGKT